MCIQIFLTLFYGIKNGKDTNLIFLKSQCYGSSTLGTTIASP